MKDIISRIIAPTIRHALTVAAGWLAARGLPTLEDSTITNLTELAAAAILITSSLAWSYLDKRKKT